MFRLGRFLISCLTLAIVVWFMVSVPIGKHTLWGHLVRIASTPEARDLTDGAKEAAKDAAQRVGREVKAVAPPPGTK